MPIPLLERQIPAGCWAHMHAYQMGAWFVMSAVGLFSMDGGTTSDPAFDLSTPLFDKITISLDNQGRNAGD